MPDGGYDAGYAVSPCFWGRAPSSFVLRLVRILGSVKGLSVLDAGCGEGKNAHFLADQGARVTAVDCSELALSHARTTWELDGVEWLLADIRDMTWPACYFDLVIAYGVFHCLASEADVTKVVRRLQQATRPGGYHVLCTFNSRSQDLTAHPDFSPCLLDHWFYLDLYRTWSLIAATDEDLTEA